MPLIDYKDIAGECLENILKSEGILYEETDLRGKVAHSGFGGASKIVYTNPHTKKKVLALQTCDPYCADDYVSRIWYFDEDFTFEFAHTFLAERFMERERERKNNCNGFEKGNSQSKRS